jgi:hypothetical protein
LHSAQKVNVKVQSSSSFEIAADKKSQGLTRFFSFISSIVSRSLHTARTHTPHSTRWTLAHVQLFFFFFLFSFFFHHQSFFSHTLTHTAQQSEREARQERHKREKERRRMARRLKDLINEVRECKTASDERAVVQKVREMRER